MPLLGKSADRDARLRGGGVLIADIVFLGGFIALLPFDLFDSNPAYRYFAEIGDDWAWAIGAMGLSAGQWVAIREYHEPLLRWCGYALTLCLLCAALCFIAGNYRSVLGYVFLLLTWWEATLMSSTKANLAGSVLAAAGCAVDRLRVRFRHKPGAATNGN